MAAERRIRFLDLRAVHAELHDELVAAAARVVDSGRYVLGPELEAFEAEWAAATGAAHAVGVGNGLDALTLALGALGVGRGHEVLVPSNAYIACWLAISAAGARPVPVEPDPETHLVTPAAARAAAGPRTAAILPVHLYGLPVDVDGFERLAADLGVALLLDAAQAHGASLDGQTLGGRGHATAWSFYPGKNLGALGDGGAVTTDDAGLARRLRRLRNYGSETRYAHAERGANSRLDELQAALLRVKLPRLERWNARRAAVAALYLDGLQDGGLGLPVEPPGRRSAWHLFVVRSRERDALQRQLAQKGVETLIHYPAPPHLQGAYADLAGSLGPLPVAERLAAEVLSLPIGPHLSDEDAAAVVAAVRL